MHFRDFGTGDGGGSDPAAADAASATTKVRTFMAQVSAVVPAIVTLTIDPVVDLLDSADGKLLDSFTTPTIAPLVGSGTASYASTSGAVVNWRTNGIRNGRRIRGRSFLVPLSASQYGNDGQLIPAARTRLQDAATALADRTGTPDLVVFARPTSAGATDGTLSVVTAASVPSLVAVLRSRRD